MLRPIQVPRQAIKRKFRVSTGIAGALDAINSP